MIDFYFVVVQSKTRTTLTSDSDEIFLSVCAYNDNTDRQRGIVRFLIVRANTISVCLGGTDRPA